MSDVVVIGSMNMDLVVKMREIPKIGETLLGEELLQIPGGKGANQGVAISKLGNSVSFLGIVGNDNYGDLMIRSMKDAGVSVENIERGDKSTGIAVINVDKHGNNNIVVIPGANSLVDKRYLERHRRVIEKSKIVLFQLEIPLDTVKDGLKIAKELNKITLLNPAPAQDLDDETIKHIDILIPNEHELERLSKVRVLNDDDLLMAANMLLKKGVKEVIVTLGSKGALYVTENYHKFFNAYNVAAVDTTAAGDSFIGGFTSAYLKEEDIFKAIDFGQKAAALTVQRIGAQTSLPILEEVEGFK